MRTYGYDASHETSRLEMQHQSLPFWSPAALDTKALPPPYYKSIIILGTKLIFSPLTADFVQELYLKELKAYKPTPVKDSDAVGQVQTFSVPQTPKSPEESDLANSLKEYESMAVEVEGNEGVAAGSAPPVAQDWLVEEEEEETGHGH